MHPYLPQHELLEYLEEKGIVAEAYSPLGSTDSPLLKDEDIKDIADKHGVSAGTILISYQGEPREVDLLLSRLSLFARLTTPPDWVVNRNVVVLPKSVTEQRIIDNLKIVKLDAEDMDTLNSLYKTKGQRFIKPE